MSPSSRVAIYWLPDGALADLGAHWLGHDIRTGTAPPGPAHAFADLVAPARQYGLHATLKAPFRLAPGATSADLVAAVRDLAAILPAPQTPGLALTELHGFLALRPEGETSALDTTVARLMRDLDRFRAPLTEADLARRRAAGLTPAQERNLARWGYPHVLDEFRFHVTLSGPVDPASLARLRDHLAPRLGPHLPRPFRMDRIALVAEQSDGSFRHVESFALTG